LPSGGFAFLRCATGERTSFGGEKPGMLGVVWHAVIAVHLS
jgi:hypothetical protein